MAGMPHLPWKTAPTPPRYCPMYVPPSPPNSPIGVAKVATRHEKDITPEQWLNGEATLDCPNEELGYRQMVINIIPLCTSEDKTWRKGSTSYSESHIRFPFLQRENRALARNQFRLFKETARSHVRDHGIRGFGMVVRRSLGFNAGNLLIAESSARGVIAATLLAGPQILLGACLVLAFVLAEIGEGNGSGTGGIR